MRQSHSERDIHVPRGPSDGHLSVGDSYLVACTIFAALHDGRPAFGPVAVCLTHANEDIGKHNKK